MQTTIQLIQNIIATKNIKMKNINIIIISLIFFASCKSAKLSNANSSTTKPISTDTAKKIYSPIADSLGYMKEIKDNKQKYINKELAVLLNDLKIEPKSYSTHHANKTFCEGISIFFDDFNTNRDKMFNTKNLNFEKPCELRIKWATPILRTDIWAHFNNTAAGEWTSAQEAYFSKLIISDIW